VLVIAPASDIFRTAAETAAIERAVASRPAGSGVGRVWRVDGVDHLMAAQTHPAEYRQTLASFLAEALDASQPVDAFPSSATKLVHEP
jgi:hypothetical protein